MCTPYNYLVELRAVVAADLCELGATLAMVFVAQLFRRPRLRDVPENHESCLASVRSPMSSATHLRVPHWGFDFIDATRLGSDRRLHCS